MAGGTPVERPGRRTFLAREEGGAYSAAREKSLSAGVLADGRRRLRSWSGAAEGFGVACADDRPDEAWRFTLGRHETIAVDAVDVAVSCLNSATLRHRSLANKTVPIFAFFKPAAIPARSSALGVIVRIEQDMRRGSQRLSDRRDDIHRRRVFAALNIANVISRAGSAFGKLVLGQT